MSRLYFIIGGVAVAALLVFAVMSHFSSDQKTRDKLEKITVEAANVVEATRTASGNPEVTWKTAAGQIIALGDSNRSLKSEIVVQNEAIDDLAREAIRLRKKAADLQLIADKAKAQRRVALLALSDMALTPGTREDCLTLLREAEDALDLVRGAGV